MSTSLLDQLATEENLQSAWALLRKENEDSYGLSGITIKEFGQNLDSNLNQISKELKDKTFRFSPTRAAVIKKDNGKYRPLQIPEIRDRVVLKAMAILLEEQLAGILSKSEGVSFAYQRGKGVRDALLRMKSIYLQGGKVILKADIINFFEEVQKDKLLTSLIYPNLPDESINKLIDESMSQKLGGLRKLNKHRKLFKNVGKGIPQGNPLSPLLSNIYLSDFDSQLKEAGYAIVRYADDFIVIFKSDEDAKNGYEKIASLLKSSYSLMIHPLGDKEGKTAILNPTETDFSFLSVKFDGDNIYPSITTVGYLKHQIKKIIKNGKLDAKLFSEVYEAIEKWIAIYSYLDIERYFDQIDEYLVSQLTKAFGVRKYKVSKCHDLAQKKRAKQHDKSTTSFWRNPALVNILPKFMRYKVRSIPHI